MLFRSNKVKTIEMEAFSGCSSLTKINIPSTVTKIDIHVFTSCSSLTEIKVEENNAEYCDEEGVLFDKNKTKLICYPSNKIGENYTIPHTVVKIESHSFNNCKNLISIDIPNSVVNIDQVAFINCSALRSIKIPKGVKGIAFYTFSGCSSLISITIPESVTVINKDAFNACNKELLTIYCKKDSEA